jgi:hypothetical protein
MSVSSLVRHATQVFIDDLKRTGSMRMRIDFKDGIPSADGRSAWGERRGSDVGLERAILNDAPNPEALPSKGRVSYSNQNKPKK